jgi:hypothetical protein
MKFYKLFDIFRSNKKKDKEDIDNHLACIKYYLDSEAIKIDIKIEDMGDESIKSLSTLLNALAAEDAFNNTLKIIENFFIEANEYQSLIKLYSSLDPKIIKRQLSNRENSPYIKPSEMIK